MPEPSPQQPQTRSSMGYRPLISGGLTSGIGSSAYGYVAAAAGLGLVIGVAAAIAGGHTKVAAAPQVSAALGAHTSGLSTLSKANALTGPSLLNQIDNRKKAGAGSGLLLPVDLQSAKKHAGAHKRHAKGKHKRAKRRPYVSPNPPDEPTALQLATAAAAAGPFFLGIQGDVTAASYDDATGTIQTYEGETYILDKTAGDSNTIHWQDFPFNVHSRCDGSGNCTLFHGGASATAKLTR
jgi:hypothetical protein